jgi:hypothetical protein
MTARPAIPPAGDRTPALGGAEHDPTPASAGPVVAPRTLLLLATDDSLACVDDLCLPADASALEPVAEA